MAGLMIEHNFFFKDVMDYIAVSDIRTFHARSLSGKKFYFSQISCRQSEFSSTVIRKYKIMAEDEKDTCAYLETEFNGRELHIILNDADSVESIALMEMDSDISMPNIVARAIADILVRWVDVKKKVEEY